MKSFCIILRILALPGLLWFIPQGLAAQHHSYSKVISVVCGIAAVLLIVQIWKEITVRIHE